MNESKSNIDDGIVQIFNILTLSSPLKTVISLVIHSLIHFEIDLGFVVCNASDWSMLHMRQPIDLSDNNIVNIFVTLQPQAFPYPLL